MSAPSEAPYCVNGHTAVWGPGSTFGRDLARLREKHAGVQREVAAPRITLAEAGRQGGVAAAAKRGAGPRKVLMPIRRAMPKS